MKLREVVTGMVTLALLAGCATPGGVGPGAPIEERGPSAMRAKRPVPALPPKAQTPPQMARVPESRVKAPRATLPPRSGAAMRSGTEAARGAPVPALPPPTSSRASARGAMSESAMATPSGTSAPVVPGSAPEFESAPATEPGGGALIPRAMFPSESTPDSRDAPSVSAPPLPRHPADDRYDGPASPPVLALVDLAQRQIDRGQMEAGAASLERALAIEPHNPHLWHRLARLRLAQGALAQAAELAAKSNLYAAATPALQVRNWRMIAEVRERQGDGRGAQDAYRRAELAEELAR